MLVSDRRIVIEMFVFMQSKYEVMLCYLCLDYIFVCGRHAVMFEVDLYSNNKVLGIFNSWFH